MITDIFARRYADTLDFDNHWAADVIAPTLVQAGHIFLNDVPRQFQFKEDFFRDINQKLARELRLTTLRRPSSSANEQHICISFLTAPLEDNLHADPDYYCMTRLSMLELLFRATEDRVRRLGTVHPTAVGFQNIVSRAIEELNERLRMSGTPLVYSNGFLHLATDDLSEERIAKPFWEIVAHPKWATVDQEMKEAFDRLDRNQNDAFTHAFDALESTIKIISDENGWS